LLICPLASSVIVALLVRLISAESPQKTFNEEKIFLVGVLHQLPDTFNNASKVTQYTILQVLDCLITN
jgi:hypothetical protein